MKTIHETARVYDINAIIIHNDVDVLVANIEPHQTMFISSLVSVLRFLFCSFFQHRTLLQCSPILNAVVAVFVVVVIIIGIVDSSQLD